MNKARINKNGFLSIKRGGTEYKDQLCPRQPQSETNVKKCGDWCPLFGEIEEKKDRDRKTVRQQLMLCSGAVIGHIADNRRTE